MHEPFNEGIDDEGLNELFESISPVPNVEPRPGFYAAVMNRIESQKVSIWSIFSDSLFAKRLSYASLTFLVLLGTYFVSSTENDVPLRSSMPEAVLTGEDLPQPVGNNPQEDRTVVLVNLASYQE